jgi:hypothetical protein
MIKIELTARFLPEGKLVPVEFRFDGLPVLVQDVGRQWQTENGRHLLVQDFQHRTYHLFFQLEDLGWYLIQDLKPNPEQA